jgi:hypothetical protein
MRTGALPLHAGTESLQTLRWSKADSNRWSHLRAAPWGRHHRAPTCAELSAPRQHHCLPRAPARQGLGLGRRLLAFLGAAADFACDVLHSGIIKCREARSSQFSGDERRPPAGTSQ